MVAQAGSRGASTKAQIVSFIFLFRNMLFLGFIVAEESRCLQGPIALGTHSLPDPALTANEEASCRRGPTILLLPSTKSKAGHVGKNTR